MRLLRLSKEQWSQFSEDAHVAVFEKKKPAEIDRIDYAMLVVNCDETPLAYITCREIDSSTIYWQFGGAFPPLRKTYNSFIVCKELIEYFRNKYKRITMLIENTNTAMLKMALKCGFLISGVRVYKGTILVEHLLEFEHGNE